MRPLFHVVEAGSWPSWSSSGEYRPESLDSQGFVHFSFADQVEGTANVLYADSSALDVVEVDASVLDVPVIVEDSYGLGVGYPHVYGPVPVSSAVAVRPMRRVGDRWVFPVVYVSAVVLRDPFGRVLSVRKRDTSWFMFPGGKPEPDESPVDAAVRELREELSVALRPDELVTFGVFAADAANEVEHVVEGTVFIAPDVDVAVLRPAAEIEELRWESLETGEYSPDLASLSAKVFDILRER